MSIEAVLSHLERDYYHAINFSSGLALCTPKDAAMEYRGLIGSLSTTVANRIWGRPLISAVAYQTTNATYDIVGSHAITRVAVVRIEFTLRRAGRVLGFVSCKFKKDGCELKYSWRDLGYLDPFSGTSALLLEQAWQGLGYMITRHIAPAQMQAEMALAMIAALSTTE